MPFRKSLKNAKKYILIFSFIFLACIISGTSIYAMTLKDVIIFYNDKLIQTVTEKDTVGEVLEENGIHVDGYDYINLSLDEEIKREKINIISIKKAVDVNIYLNGQAVTIKSTRDTVKDLLDALYIDLNDDDRIEGALLDSKIVSGMDIKIIKVAKDIIVEYEEIPCPVVRVENETMDINTKRVIQEGINQKNVNIYNAVWENNVLISKELKETRVVVQPVEEIIEYGIVKTHVTSDGTKIRYTKLLDMTGTAYTTSYEECGKTPDDPAYGITYTGEKVRHGIVAVDPEVIPLLTNLYIESTDGYKDYGFSLAADIGTGVEGNIIDMYAGTMEQACDWGMRPVKVYILAEED